MFYRLYSLVQKELQALLRDKQGRMLLIVPVVLQIAIFALAATLEVKNNTLAVLNEDSGETSFELIQRFSKAQEFSRIIHLRDEKEMTRVIENQDALHPGWSGRAWVALFLGIYQSGPFHPGKCRDSLGVTHPGHGPL